MIENRRMEAAVSIASDEVLRFSGLRPFWYSDRNSAKLKGKKSTRKSIFYPQLARKLLSLSLSLLSVTVKNDPVL
jgi:uncharacterized protein YjeT (DUF2065 family)